MRILKKSVTAAIAATRIADCYAVERLSGRKVVLDLTRKPWQPAIARLVLYRAAENVVGIRLHYKGCSTAVGYCSLQNLYSVLHGLTETAFIDMLYIQEHLSRICG